MRQAQLMEAGQAAALGRAESKVQILAQICHSQAFADSQHLCTFSGDFHDSPQALVARGGEQRLDLGRGYIRAGNPHGEDERQPGPLVPALTEVPNLAEII